MDARPRSRPKRRRARAEVMPEGIKSLEQITAALGALVPNVRSVAGGAGAGRPAHVDVWCPCGPRRKGGPPRVVRGTRCVCVLGHALGVRVTRVRCGREGPVGLWQPRSPAQLRCVAELPS
jgi:hypothetical protein